MKVIPLEDSLNLPMGKRIVSGQALLGFHENEFRKSSRGFGIKENQILINELISEVRFILSKKEEGGKIVNEYDDDLGRFINTKYNSGFYGKIPDEITPYYCKVLGEGTDGSLEIIPRPEKWPTFNSTLVVGSIDSFVSDLSLTWPVRLYAFFKLIDIYDLIKNRVDVKIDKKVFSELIIKFSNIASRYLDNRFYLNLILENKIVKSITKDSGRIS